MIGSAAHQMLASKRTRCLPGQMVLTYGCAFLSTLQEAAAVSAASQPRKTSRGASRSQIAHASSFQGSAALGDDSARFKSRLELMREEAEAARSARSDNPTPKTKPHPAEGELLPKRSTSIGSRQAGWQSEDWLLCWNACCLNAMC